MPELELTRTREDRKLYVLEGVGTLRLRGWLTKSATADAGARSWGLSRGGGFTPGTEAFDAAGTLVGSFGGRTIKRGGTLSWGGRELTLQPASMFKDRYALIDAS